MAAERVDRLGNVLRGPRGRALEEHVLDEMRDAALLIGFVAGAAGQPDPDRHGSDRVDTFGDETETVVEDLADNHRHR